jgi:NAD(P)-dependent dehydrogenase (short-subunit alcohol dehydrogenase family)
MRELPPAGDARGRRGGAAVGRIGAVATTEATMRGRVCLVTGASSGIGEQTALGLARMGATVLLVCRDRGRGEAAAVTVAAESGNPAVELFVADLSSQKAIRALAEEVREAHDRIHVLVNNAGAVLPRRSVSMDGIEATFALNHLAYFLLTDLLLEPLTASAPARIVNVASGAHAAGRIDFDDLQGERNYHGWRAYTQSKLANVLFTYELARRLAGTGVTANCLHPGVVRSNFGRDLSGAIGLAYRAGRLLMISPERGAATPLYLAASAEVEGASGGYYEGARRRRSAPSTYDEAVARRLWQVSEALTCSPPG